MKIPPIVMQGLLATHEAKTVHKVAYAQPVMRSDAAEISGDAASFGQVFRAVKGAIEQDTPAAQAHRAQVATQIAGSQYDIPARDIARSMLRGVALDKDI